MPRPPSTTPTDAERAILEVLWDCKEASVREVAEALSKTKPTAYTTALTMLKILERKGYVHHRAEGRAFIYRAAISRREARRGALQQVLAQFFNGSPKVLAQHLLDEHALKLDELEALHRRVDEADDGEHS